MKRLLTNSHRIVFKEFCQLHEGDIILRESNRPVKVIGTNTMSLHGGTVIRMTKGISGMVYEVIYDHVHLSPRILPLVDFLNDGQYYSVSESELLPGDEILNPYDNLHYQYLGIKERVRIHPLTYRPQLISERIYQLIDDTPNGKQTSDDLYDEWSKVAYLIIDLD